MRKLLFEMLRDDSDFDAFCMDYFYSIKQCFSLGMNRVQKANMLFEKAELKEIFHSLQLCNPEQFQKYYDSTMNSMKPPKNILSLDSCIKDLSSQDVDPLNKMELTIGEPSLTALQDIAQNLLNSLPSAPLEDRDRDKSPDIFADPSLVPEAPPLLYSLPSGCYMAHSLTITENYGEPGIESVLRPGYKFNIRNEPLTGMVSVLTVKKRLLGSGAVRNNIGTLTSIMTLRNDSEQWQSEITIQFQIVDDARVSLSVEDRKTCRKSLSIWKRDPPDGILRWNMVAVYVTPA